MSCQTQIITNETNQRIYNRNIPSSLLPYHLEVRPVNTKYTYFPILEPRNVSIENPSTKIPYQTNLVFFPGNTTAPLSGYSVNDESQLRNQIYPLSKCSQTVYIPSSKSQLYNAFLSNTPSQSHSLLFNKEPISKTICFLPQYDSHSMFYHSTRSNLNSL